jgi:hypothetical protein
MADITMCTDNACPRATTCYRFTATPSKLWQSMFASSPRKEDGTCEEYWEVTRKPEHSPVDEQAQQEGG